MASAEVSDQHDVTGHLPLNTDEVFTFTETSLHNDFISQLVKMRQNEFLTDVELKTGNVKVRCHSLVLCGVSTYFHNLFDTAMRSGTPLHSIELPNVDPEVLVPVVNFLYTTHVKIKADHVLALARSGMELNLKGLKEACDNFIVERIVPANCLGLLMFASHNDLPHSAEKATMIMMTRAEEILKTALDTEFKALPIQDFSRWISSDNLDVPSEKIVFELILKWIGADNVSRRSDIDKLLKHVRLVHCEATYLIKVIDKCPLVQSPKCQEIIKEANHCMLVPELKKEMKLSNPKSRSRVPSLLPVLLPVLLGGGTGYEENDACWYLNEANNTWETLTTLPQPLAENPYYMAACQVDDSIVVTGGCEDRYLNTRASASTWAFCMPQKKWTKLEDMKNARSTHSILCVDGSVFVFGGHNGGNDLSSVEKLETIKSPNWTNMAAMVYAVYRCQAFKIENNIYVLSGADQKTQKYDIDRNSWQKMADCPTNCNGTSASILGHTIFLLGGFTEERCYCFDTNLNTWSKITNQNEMHIFPVSFEWRGNILLAGGWIDWNKNECTKGTEEYNPATGKWSTSKVVLPKTLGAGCLVKMEHAHRLI